MKNILLLAAIVFISFQSMAQKKHPEDDVYTRTEATGPGISGYFKVPVRRETDYKDNNGNYVVPAFYRIYGEENESCFYNFIKINVTVREVYLRITINDGNGDLLEAWKGKINWGQGKGIGIKRLPPGRIYYLNFYTEDNKLIFSQPFEKGTS